MAVSRDDVRRMAALARIGVPEERLGTKPENLSPAHHVKRGAPPMIVFHGKADTTVPYSLGKTLVGALPDATLFTEITHREVIEKGLKVADATAFSLCMDNDMPIMVFNLLTEGNIARAVAGEKIGTLVRS